MSYLVIARKWRPQRFEDISGQAHITRTLKNAIRAERIAHAYLFTGVRGVGKTTAARIFAKALNCEKGPTADPCNDCGLCREIMAGNSLDVLEIDGASNRGIDEVRQIIENARYQPAKSRFKIYIIDEVHQVTKDAFNALLKTLEEPPPFVKFILATTEPHRLPETILSRCQRFDFRRIPLREIVRRLSEISSQEGLRITEAALLMVAREADGSMRDAQSLLEQVLAYAEPEAAKKPSAVVDERLLHDILGIAERQVLFDISDAVLQGDGRRCVELIAEVVVQGWDLSRLSRDLVEYFRNLLIARLCEGGGSEKAASGTLLDLPDEEIEALTRQAADLSIDTLLDYFHFMAAGDEEIARSADPRFGLETTLIRLATLPKTLPVHEIVERLGELEKRLSVDRRAVVPPRTVARSPKEVRVPPSPTTGGDSGAEKDEVWKKFIAFVRKEKIFLASHLGFGTPLQLPPGELRIGIAERHHLNYFQDADNLSALKNLATQFFLDNVAVTVTPLGPGEVGVQSRRAKSDKGNEDASDDMVNEALRIFGGTVRGVRREDS
jgi:DNA polymerase III subunit gamma/tau